MSLDAGQFDGQGLGLVIDGTHVETINSFAVPPALFRAIDLSVLPPKFESPIKVWFQGSTNSCAGHAGAAAMSDAQWVASGEEIRHSPWFCYLESQRAGGFFGRDGGTSIRSVLMSLAAKGCCLESLLPRPNRYDTHISREAADDAAAHRTLGETNVDLRQWDDAIAWLTDFRPIVIGTKWHSGQRNNRGIETLNVASGGSFLGYHARELFGWETVEGVIVPRCRNSHGEAWGQRGFSAVTRDTWEWWRKDANFFALGFARINERIVRRDWSQFNVLAGEAKAGEALVV